MSLNIVLLETFHVPAGHGRTNLVNLLGKNPQIDSELFRNLIYSIGSTYDNRDILYGAYRIDDPSAGVMGLPLVSLNEIGNICAALSFLGRRSKLPFQVAGTNGRVKIFFGRFLFKGVEFVLVVERYNSHHVHCHALTLGEWTNGESSVLLKRIKG